MAVNNGIASASTIWDALDAATRARTAFTLGFLSTAGIDGQPHVRAVIPREADADAGTVFFSTHVLSAKVGEIEQNPLVAITFYDADADVQLRLEGRAELVTDERIRRTAWDSFGAGTKQLFASPLSPGVRFLKPMLLRAATRAPTQTTTRRPTHASRGSPCT